jgi:hypothetical protein
VQHLLRNLLCRGIEYYILFSLRIETIWVVEGRLFEQLLLRRLVCATMAMLFNRLKEKLWLKDGLRSR